VSVEVAAWRSNCHMGLIYRHATITRQVINLVVCRPRLGFLEVCYKWTGSETVIDSKRPICVGLCHRPYITVADIRVTKQSRILFLLYELSRHHTKNKNILKCMFISNCFVFCTLDHTQNILADRTLVTVELLSWLSSVCPSVCLSVCHAFTVAKRCKIGSGRYWSLTKSRILASKCHTYKSVILDDLERL